MANPEITNNDVAGIVIKGGIFKSELVTFAGAATLLAGTILARSTATLKMVPFVKGGSTAGNGIPSAVLINELVATGAGDLTAKPAIIANLRLSKLVINADGDASNIDGAVEDQLRTMGLVAITTNQLAELDNQ